MVQRTSACAVLVLILSSCASASAKPTPPPPASPPAAVTAAPPVTAVVDNAAAPPPEPVKPKLAAGQCVESFDCVDTVGFPPAGQRWTCDNGKCGRAKLPDLGSDVASADSAKAEPEPEVKTPSRHVRARRQR